MAYRSLPKFEPSAQFRATARLPLYNGVAMAPGDLMPPLPADRTDSMRRSRDYRQLYESRRIEMVNPLAAPEPKQRKEKAHGRRKV